MRNNPKLTEQNRDRALGCLVGGAVGDALGYVVEFESWPFIRNTYGDKGIIRYELAGNGKALISDDTQMSLFTAAGILLGMTRGDLRGHMGRLDYYCSFTYQDWLHTQEWTSKNPDARTDSWLMDVPELYARRAPGNTCISALKAIENRQMPQNNSCGCGGVMRTAPIAVICALHGYAGGDYLYCDMVAAEAARQTHKHPLGFIPSAVLNDVLMQIFDGVHEEGISLKAMVKVAEGRLFSIVSEEDQGKTYGTLWPDEVATMLRLLDKAIELSETDMPDVEAIESIGEGWTGHEALAIAVYSALKHSDSFEDAIVCSVNHSGDSDSTGAICGNIMGAIHGHKAIPDYYTENLELLNVIEEIAGDLFTGSVVSDYMLEITPEQQLWMNKYVHFKRETRK